MIEEMGGDFLQWLRGFFFVAKRGSMILAAQEMGRNQPTISHQIKRLENGFGVTLFDRSSGKMELTPEGEVFLQKAISIFEIIKEMKSESREWHLQHGGKVTITATHAIVHYFLPQFLVDFRNRHPNVQFEVKGIEHDMILHRVESAEADFGIAHLDTVPETLDSHDLFETRLRLIAQKNNPFLLKKEPTLEQIAETPFISFPRSSAITPMLEKRFSESGLKLNVVLVLNNVENVKKYVELGVGVSILNEFTLTEEDQDRLDIFPLDRLFVRKKYSLILRKRKYLPPYVKAFISDIKPDFTSK